MVKLKCHYGDFIKKLTYSVLDKFDITVLRHQLFASCIPARHSGTADAPRRLPGLDFNIAGQLELVRKFNYGEELVAIPLEKCDTDSAAYHNHALNLATPRCSTI